MRICVEKSTGKLIEMQSAASPGTLTTNAVAAGYDESAIEEKVATQEEFETALALANAPHEE